MITPMSMMYSQNDDRISTSSNGSPVQIQHQRKTTLIAPRPSSPREFFARIYGHLESEKSRTDGVNKVSNGRELRKEDIDESVEENFIECQSNTNTDSSSDVDINDSRGSLQTISTIYEQNSSEIPTRFDLQNTTENSTQNVSATAALVQLAAGNLPIPPGPPSVPRFPGISGLPGLSGLPSLHGLPGFLPPRPPFLFSGEIPFPTGFSAFLSRRRRGPGRSRRQRTTFSAAQTLRLEVEFRRAEYVGRPRRLELAAALRLSETQVKIWFQNRRAKDKRIEKAHLDHHYRTLAGLPPEYYTNFSPGSCGICLYKRDSPCAHFLLQAAKTRESSSPCSNDKITHHPDAIVN